MSPTAPATPGNGSLWYTAAGFLKVYLASTVQWVPVESQFFIQDAAPTTGFEQGDIWYSPLLTTFSMYVAEPRTSGFPWDPSYPLPISLHLVDGHFQTIKQRLEPSSSPAPTTVYTVPASKTSVVTGLTVSNISDFELPLDIFVTVGTDDYYLAKGCEWPWPRRLTGMEKMVLGADDILKSDAPTVDGGSTDTFVVWLSVYEDV